MAMPLKLRPPQFFIFLPLLLVQQLILPTVAVLCPLLNQLQSNTTSSTSCSFSQPPPFRSVSSTWLVHPSASTTVPSCSSTILLSPNGNFSFAFVPSNLDLMHTTDDPASYTSYLLSVLASPKNSLYCQVVWTANRNRPVASNAELKLQGGQGDQDVVLQDADGTLVWSANGKGVVGIRLEDSGNLVMYDSANLTVFHSFDHPTDTLLPGQTLGPQMRLVSSVSSGNTSKGMYSLVMEPGGMVLYVNTPPLLPYWLWGNDIFLNFSDIFETPCNRTGLLYASGGLNSYLVEQNMSAECNRIWDSKWDRQPFARETAYARMDPDGDLRVYDKYRKEVFDIVKNNGGAACDLPGICGPYGICVNGSTQCVCPRGDDNKGDFFKPINDSVPNLGCTLRSPLSSCNKSSQGNVQLLEMSGVDYFANDMINQTITTLYNCKQSCLSNCSCNAAFYRQNSQACYQFEHLMSLRLISDESYMAYFKVESASAAQLTPETTASNASGTRKVIIGVSVGALVIVLLLGVGFSVRYFFFKFPETTEDDEFLDTLPGFPSRYSYRDLQLATRGFSKMLGRGGFGVVYEGHLSNGTKVAIKRLDNTRQGPKEFRAEVAALGSISHVNLVRLCGFCAERSHRLLVYEYMANKSLDNWLFHERKDKSTLLDWDTRFNIALGIARGLAFLHEESRQRIIHLDIKPQNILLDENFAAKLSDFGLSKLLDETQSWAITAMRGTLGYLAPECVLQMAVSPKCDVYSFGMVLLELVGGRRNFDVSLSPEKLYFPAWALQRIEEGSIAEVVDAHLFQEDDKESVVSWEQAIRTIKIAFWCIQEDANTRPSMGKVVLMLEGHIEVHDPPWSLPFQRRTQANLSAAAAGFPSTSESSSSQHKYLLSSYGVISGR